MIATASSFQPLTLVNGEVQNVVSVADRGLAYGDGLFETMRCRNRQLPAWPLHWQRLQQGADALRLNVNLQAIEQPLKTALDYVEQQEIDDAIIKLMVTRGEGGHGYIPPATAEPNIILTVKPYQPLPLMPGECGVELKDCTYKLSHNPVLAGLKHLNRLEQVLAAQSVNLATDQQGLVFDRHDRLIETLHHNLFLIKDGILLTPALHYCGVAGVLRRAILEQCAPAFGLSTMTSHIYQTDLCAADEVFIGNSVHGITPVCRWRDKVWQEGDLTQKLSGQWEKLGTLNDC